MADKRKRHSVMKGAALISGIVLSVSRLINEPYIYASLGQFSLFTGGWASTLTYLPRCVLAVPHPTPSIQTF